MGRGTCSGRWCRLDLGDAFRRGRQDESALCALRCSFRDLEDGIARYDSFQDPSGFQLAFSLFEAGSRWV